MAELELFDQGLRGTSDEDERHAFGVPGQGGASNMKHKYLKQEFRNDPTDVITDTIEPSPDGMGFLFVATLPLVHLNTQVTWVNPDTAQNEVLVLQDGATVFVTLHGTEKQITHNAPVDGTKIPIWLQSERDYSTTGAREVFVFRLWTYPDGRYWVDCTNQSITGTVTPDFYIATRAQQRGYVATSGSSQISGFSDGEAAIAEVFGEGVFSVGSENNTADCIATGVVTGVKIGSLVFSFNTGIKVGNTAVAINRSTKRKLYLKNAGVEGFSDDGVFDLHNEGFIDCGSDVLVVGNDLIEV